MDHKPNLNVKANTVKVFEESIGEIFLAVTKKYKWKNVLISCILNWKLLHFKRYYQESEKKFIKCEKIFADHISNKRLISRIRNSYSSIIKTYII